MTKLEMVWLSKKNYDSSISSKHLEYEWNTGHEISFAFLMCEWVAGVQNPPACTSGRLRKFLKTEGSLLPLGEIFYICGRFCTSGELCFNLFSIPEHSLILTHTIKDWHRMFNKNCLYFQMRRGYMNFGPRIFRPRHSARPENPEFFGPYRKLKHDFRTER
jgi:hypothetical protein